MQEEAKDKKQRQEPRLIVDLPAQYKLDKSPNYAECCVVDISAVGLGVEIKSFLVEGDKVKLKFPLGNRDIEISCIVKYVLGKTIGLQYQNMEENEVEFIRDYVNKGFFERVKK